MKANILGCLVDQVNMEQSIEQTANFIKTGRPHQIITVNAEMVYMASQLPQLKEIINQADLVTPDGIGVVWASAQLGQPIPERVAGVDLMDRLFTLAEKEGWRVYFLGAAPGIANDAVEKVMIKHPGLQVAGINHGFFTIEEEAELIERIKAVKPQLLLVALGSPKQDYWIAKFKEELAVPVAMGVGGSFDVWAGKVKRAPRWMRRVNLEWLGRLIQEPSRYKRIIALPKFVLAVLGQKKSLVRLTEKE